MGRHNSVLYDCFVVIGEFLIRRPVSIQPAALHGHRDSRYDIINRASCKWLLHITKDVEVRSHSPAGYSGPLAYLRSR